MNVFDTIIAHAKSTFKGTPLIKSVKENRLDITVTLRSNVGEEKNYSFSDFKFVRSLQELNSNKDVASRSRILGETIEPRKLIVDRNKLTRLISVAVKIGFNMPNYPTDYDFNSELSIEMEEEINKTVEKLKQQSKELPGFVTVEYIASMEDPRYAYEVLKRFVAFNKQEGITVSSQMQDALNRPEVYFDPDYVVEGVNNEFIREDTEENVEIPIVDSNDENSDEQ